MATVDRAVPTTDLDRLCVDTIRELAIDGVQRANSGHPGMPMAMGPVAYLLYAHVLRHSPRVPAGPTPSLDRFGTSAPGREVTARLGITTEAIRALL